MFNYDDATCHEMAGAGRRRWRGSPAGRRCPSAAYVEDQHIVLEARRGRAAGPAATSGISPARTPKNALAAVAIAGVMGVPCETMREVLKTFRGVGAPHSNRAQAGRRDMDQRLEGNERRFHAEGHRDDEQADGAHPRRATRKVSFDPLAKSIVEAPLIEHCVLIGDTANQIGDALDPRGLLSLPMTGYDFDLCLATCRKLAKKGGNVLLSPGLREL